MLLHGLPYSLCDVTDSQTYALYHQIASGEVTVKEVCREYQCSKGSLKSLFEKYHLNYPKFKKLIMSLFCNLAKCYSLTK